MFFRLLGNGFLSPILLVKMIFISTIGSVTMSVWLLSVIIYKHGSFFYVSLLFQVRVVNGVLPTGDYSFAKYNKVAKFVLLSVFVLLIHCLYFLVLFTIFYLMWCSLLTLSNTQTRNTKSIWQILWVIMSNCTIFWKFMDKFA